MGFANNLIPAEILRDPSRMQSLNAYLLGQEAESSVALDGETYPVEANPRAWMFDIDGTLTVPWENGQPGKRGWYEYERLLEDVPNPATLELAWTLRRAEIPLVFLTARPERWAELTLQWLDRNFMVTRGTPTDEVNLFMRPDGDEDVPDELVKLTLYRTLVKPRWTILGVFEDNPKCINTWLDEGLPVFQPHCREQEQPR